MGASGSYWELRSRSQAARHVYLVPDALPPVPSLPSTLLRICLAVSEALASYTAAVEAGAAPRPLPLYAEQQQGAAAAAPGGGSMDVAFELLRLHAVASDPDSSGSATALQPLLARLLRCEACPVLQLVPVRILMCLLLVPPCALMCLF